MIKDKAGREFEDILYERGVVAGLNDLERLAGEAKSKKVDGVPAPNHP